MSRRHFSWLAVITLLVAAAVLLMPGRTGQESSVEKSRLMPALQAKVNELDWLRVVGAGDATVATLVRTEGGWQVEEYDGYAADWEQLRSLLAGLAQAEVVEAKTANPDYYDRLGVEDVSRPDAGGLRLEFAPQTGLPAVILGDRAQGREGQYVRVEGEAASALVDRVLEAPAQALDWVERDIVDISDAEVVEFDVTHPDGERLRGSRASADDEDFVLDAVPEGREVQSAWSVNSMASGLSALRLDGVAPEAAQDWSGAVRYGLVTADGLRLDADVLAVAPGSAGEDAEEGDAETEYWIRLEAGLYQTAVDRPPTEPAEADESGAAVETAEQRAQGINDRVAGWAYRIPQYKYDSMTKRIESLLKSETPADES